MRIIASNIGGEITLALRLTDFIAESWLSELQGFMEDAVLSKESFRKKRKVPDLANAPCQCNFGLKWPLGGDELSVSIDSRLLTPAELSPFVQHNSAGFSLMDKLLAALEGLLPREYAELSRLPEEFRSFGIWSTLALNCHRLSPYHVDPLDVPKGMSAVLVFGEEATFSVPAPPLHLLNLQTSVELGRGDVLFLSAKSVVHGHGLQTSFHPQRSSVVFYTHAADINDDRHRKTRANAETALLRLQHLPKNPAN